MSEQVPKFSYEDEIIMKSVYTINEVAEYFKVSTRTIRVWLKKDDTFPRPFKKYGTLRFNRTEIEQYWMDNVLMEDDFLSEDSLSMIHS